MRQSRFRGNDRSQIPTNPKRRQRWQRSQSPRSTRSKLEQFVFTAVDEIGATLNAALVVIGDRLGLYRALAGAGPLDAAELAARTGTAERVRARVAERAGRGRLRRRTTRRAAATAPARAGRRARRRGQPHVPPGLFQLALGAVIDSPRIAQAMRTGEGVGWHEHGADVHDGCERFFRPGYTANLVATWLPALDGVVAQARARRDASPTSAAATARRRS